MLTAFRASVMALALVGVMASPACTQLANLFGHEQVSTYDEKAAISVEKLFAYANDQTTKAAPSLTVDQAKTASALLAKAKAAVDKARELYNRNAEAEASPKTAEALAALQQVISLLVSAGVLK